MFLRVHVEAIIELVKLSKPVRCDLRNNGRRSVSVQPNSTQERNRRARMPAGVDVSSRQLPIQSEKLGVEA